MLFIFLVIAGRTRDHRPLEFNPDNIQTYDKDKMFVLKQYPQQEYDNVSECLFTEYKPGDSNFKIVIDSIRKDFDKLPKPDLSDNLVDQNNDLTDDERFAIYLYTNQSPNIYDPMAKDLTKGVTGVFNCYFNYLNKAFQKLKPLSEVKTIYRGSNKEKLSNAGTKIEAFKKGIYASTTSFTSTSINFKTSMSFAHYYNDPVMFEIKACRNPRNISMLSKSQNEEELLYPPSSKFKIIDAYTKWCIYKPYDDLVKCDDKKLTDDYEIFKFVELEEIDEDYGPFPVIDRPAPTSTPKPRRCVSSCNDNLHLKSQKSSKILGNFNIKNIYIGASFVFDFDIGYSLMHNARKTIGHYIPAPNFLHPAIWVGSGDATDEESLGVVFVYGKYYPEDDNDDFILKDGLKSFSLSFKDFKAKYDAFDPVKLIPQRKINVFDFINEVKSNGNWNAKDYKWNRNNCQHFVTKCLSILHAVRFLPNENDWINIPSKILKELKLNEKKISN